MWRVIYSSRYSRANGPTHTNPGRIGPRRAYFARWGREGLGAMPSQSQGLKARYIVQRMNDATHQHVQAQALTGVMNSMTLI